jgi:hypothetical protein
MVRSIIGVIDGYILMVVLQVAAFMSIYNWLGPDWSFKSATFQASTRWHLMQFVVILLTAAIAGLVCALIAGRGKACVALAGLVIVIGMVLGILSHSARSAYTRPPGPVPGMEAMRKANHPLWLVLVNPFVAGVGIIAGGSLRRAR